MTKPNTLNAGDRVAYSAKMLRDTRQQTGNAGARRGTFAGFSGTMGWGRVKWDNFEHGASRLAELYGADYVDDARQNGQLVALSAIAKVGSPRFACNDL